MGKLASLPTRNSGRRWRSERWRARGARDGDEHKSRRNRISSHADQHSRCGSDRAEKNVKHFYRSYAFPFHSIHKAAVGGRDEGDHLNRRNDQAFFINFLIQVRRLRAVVQDMDIAFFDNLRKRGQKYHIDRTEVATLCLFHCVRTSSRLPGNSSTLITPKLAENARGFPMHIRNLWDEDHAHLAAGENRFLARPVTPEAARYIQVRRYRSGNMRITDQKSITLRGSHQQSPSPFHAIAVRLPCQRSRSRNQRRTGAAAFM